MRAATATAMEPPDLRVGNLPDFGGRGYVAIPPTFLEILPFLPATACGIMSLLYRVTVGDPAIGKKIRPNTHVILPARLATSIGLTRNMIAPNVELLQDLGLVKTKRIGQQIEFTVIFNLPPIDRKTVEKAAEKALKVASLADSEVESDEEEAEPEANRQRKSCTVFWAPKDDSVAVPADRKPIPVVETDKGKVFVENSLPSPVQINLDVRDGDLYLSLASQFAANDAERAALTAMLNDALQSSLGYVDPAIVDECLGAMAGELTVAELRVGIEKQRERLFTGKRRSWGGVIFVAQEQLRAKRAAVAARPVSSSPANVVDDDMELRAAYEEYRESAAADAFKALPSSEQEHLTKAAAKELAQTFASTWQMQTPAQRKDMALVSARRSLNVNLMSFAEWKASRRV